MKNKRGFIAIIIVIIVIIVISFFWFINNIMQEQSITTDASIYCLEQGHSLQVIKNETGEFGICTDDEGDSCEESEYYNKNCELQNE